MSRVGDYDGDEDWPNQAAFWRANAKRALRGKNGRKALAELREALLMLPAPRLVEGAVSTASLAVEAEALPTTRTDWKGEQIANWEKADKLHKCEQEGEGVCAVGAYLLRKRVLELGEPVDDAMRNLPSLADIDGNTLQETAEIGEAAGLSQYVAVEIAYRNDETYENCTPEERYILMLAWIDTELARGTEATP